MAGVERATFVWSWSRESAELDPEPQHSIIEDKMLIHNAEEFLPLVVLRHPSIFNIPQKKHPLLVFCYLQILICCTWMIALALDENCNNLQGCNFQWKPLLTCVLQYCHLWIIATIARSTRSSLQVSWLLNPTFVSTIACAVR